MKLTLHLQSEKSVQLAGLFFADLFILQTEVSF